MTPFEVADLCWHFGWRDKNLIAMVAIVGAETNYDESFSDGSHLGLFALKINAADSHTLLDPNEAVKVARNIYEDRYFVEWTSFITGKYLRYIRQAVDGAGKFYVSLFEKEFDG